MSDASNDTSTATNGAKNGAAGGASSRPGRTLAIVVAIVIVAGAGLVWWWLSGDEPAEVDLTQQVGGADADDPADDGAADDAADVDDPADGGAADGAGDADDPTGDASAEDLDGTWVVDTDSIPFDGQAGEGSFVGYRVDEELTTVGDFTAVGRTPDVTGEIVVEGGQVVATTIAADLTTLESDSSTRDGRVRSSLGPDAAASFTLGDAFALELPPPGEVAVIPAAGELTILDTTLEIEVELQTAVIDDQPVVAGRVTVLLSDYGVTVPSAPIVISASDEAVLEWQLFLTRS